MTDEVIQNYIHKYEIRHYMVMREIMLTNKNPKDLFKYIEKRIEQLNKKLSE